ncbi:DNA polymerase III subunit delta' [Salinisphaera sp. C84B14]|uniref:DNA polymerase III subunit delta' n=1 Tax=Salinisphaera sp. C84B14 TaxID=1304155 RepID=UPI003341F36A
MSDTPADDVAKPSWHATLWTRMAQAMAMDRVAHGLLVCGPPGIGKRVFAERIVAALLCRAPDRNGDACGHCAACRQRQAETHPDISRLTPEETGKLIKVDQVRAFSQRLQLTPQYDSGRIGWIDPAEALSPSAANSLLKTLEEPPPACHIVLVTDRVSALMPTIRSRCQLWRLAPPEPDEARQWLEARQVDCDGLDVDSLRTPFAVVDRHAQDYATLIDGWDSALSDVIRNREDPASAAERLAKQPADLLTDWLYRRASGLLSLALMKSGDPADNSQALPESLARVATRMDPHAFQPWCAQVAEAARLARSNADWQLVVESLLLDLKTRLKRKPSR